MIGNVINKLKGILHSRHMRNKWRVINAHNSTYLKLIPKSDVFFEKVTVGRLTYGPIHAYYSNHPLESLSIGSFCSIGEETKFILGSEHPYSGLTTFPFKVKSLGFDTEAVSKGPIILEDDVWLGENVIVLSGVKIGQGAVVAAGSVVVKSVPPYAIVGGNPAKVIKYRFSEKIIDILVNIDLNQLADSKIREKVDLLYEPIDDQNIDSILSELSLKTNLHD